MPYIYGKLNSTEFYDNGGPLDPPDPNWVLMTSYPPPASTANPANQYFEYRAQPDGTWKEFAIPAPAKVLVIHDGKIKLASCYYLEANPTEIAVTALPGFPTAKRRIRVNITLGASGVGTLDLTPYAFAAAPDVDPIVTSKADNTVSYIPRIVSVSATSLSVSAVRTKGTLLLTAGPVEQAASGDVVSVWLLEK